MTSPLLATQHYFLLNRECVLLRVSVIQKSGAPKDPAETKDIIILLQKAVLISLRLFLVPSRDVLAV